MWWSETEGKGRSPAASGGRRRAMSLLMAAGGALLAACTLAPALGPGSGAEALRGRVRVHVDATGDLGFVLAGTVEDTLGMSDAAAPFSLEISVQTSESEAGRLPDRGSTRRRIVGRARWQLLRRGGERPLASGEVASFTAYDVAGTPLAERTARRNARARLGRDLGRRVVEAVLLSAPQIRTGNGGG